MLHPCLVPITRMLLDESPLIVHCSFKEWIGFYFSPSFSPGAVALVLLWPPFSSLVSLNYSYNSRTPIKKTKKKSLTKEQKQFNKRLAKERIVVEHVHRKLKIFRRLSSRYRNRRRRFGLRINLIAGIYNYDLYLSLQQAST